ncbi:aldehyde-activating protein [Acuticoccus sp. MNP-M23]|uniref:GFA family protein n=1 Tax=Acuticoccus sp. MNP-M23 TaxID=3072793 RepID=UPI0028159323|nr:aldehyde-activating protein [Acuticoccus sp. MNP-M23]WMS41143.1 aldehyde-activating protein [Acuticoccus sp. MNP-M23]
MTGQCLCGAVRVTIESKPEFIHDCNCNLCRKSGGAWGYFATGMVAVAGNTASFLRRDKANAAAEVHSCTTCGSTTHWSFSDAFRAENASVDLMGVNMRIFDPQELAGVEVRYPDGNAWAGAGPFEYRREAMTIGEGSPW